MTTIDRLGGPSRGVAIGRERLGRVGGAGFALPEAPPAPLQAGGLAEATPASLVGAMVALQEAELKGARDRAARRHGETMLDELRALQVRLLDGGGAPELLGRLATLAEVLPEAADPKLAALVRAVALRAEIELARRVLGAGCGSMCAR
ncbi:MAG: flagellar assembly protein FliX [Acetobacteraceae bacterium]